MLVEQKVKKLFNQLLHGEIAQITLGHNDITVRIFDGASKLSFSTEVYLGGNYIPESVRLCLKGTPPFESKIIKTYRTVDEENFQIFLHYLGRLNHLNHQGFVDLIEEFSWLADHWKLYLDEHDKRDLVHVRQ